MIINIIKIKENKMNIIFNEPNLAFIEGALIGVVIVLFLSWRYIKLFKRDIKSQN